MEAKCVAEAPTTRPVFVVALGPRAVTENVAKPSKRAVRTRSMALFAASPRILFAARLTILVKAFFFFLFVCF